METVVQSPNLSKDSVPVFQLWESGRDRRRERNAGVVSLVLHVVAIIGLLLMPRSVVHQVQRVAHSITPLIAPAAELTQPTPNKGKISKEITASAVTPRPNIQIPPSPPSTTRPAARVLAMPSRNAAGPGPSLPEPPPVAGPGNAPPEVAQAMAPPPPPPQIQAQEKPKLAFESPAAPPSPSGNSLGRWQAQAPGSAITEAARSVARGGGGGLIVGDIGAGIGPGGIGEALNMPPSPGRQASALELLTDPQGVDFRPYLIQILSVVRRNWFAVMPESAKLGRRGKVTIQFAVNRVGRVPKLVIVGASGTDALDRAAVAGISASNPFPPLPTDFKGEQVRLQFTFLYNIPAN